jgi:YD repeat-containing protein
MGIYVADDNTAALTATLWGTGTWANTTDWGGEGTIVTGTVNVWGDPAFVDPDAGDYHITATSAARDAGVNAGVSVDIDGEMRPEGSGYDVGVDEYYTPTQASAGPSQWMAGRGRGLLSPVAWVNPSADEDGGATYDDAKIESGHLLADAIAAPAGQGSGAGSSGDGADGELGSVILWGEDGTRTRLLLHPDGWLEPYPGVRLEIGWEGDYPDVTYVITRSNQYVYRFDREGRLQQRIDPRGHVISYTYNLAGQLATVTDVGSGRSLRFSYDGEHLERVEDPLGRTVRFGYDGAGDLAVVTGTRGYTWTYAYTGAHLLDEVRDPLGHLVEKTEYDDEGRAWRQSDEMGIKVTLDYDYHESSSAPVYFDALGNMYTDFYDDRGAWLGQEDPQGNVSIRTYDVNFNLTGMVDQNDNATHVTWDECGCNVTSVTDALDNTTAMEYDALNHLTAQTDATGSTTRYEYDGNLLITTTDALSGTVINTYDQDNGLLVQTVGHGITTTYGYDELGQRVAITDAVGNATTYGYRCMGLSRGKQAANLKILNQSESRGTKAKS